MSQSISIIEQRIAAGSQFDGSAGASTGSITTVAGSALVAGEAFFLKDGKSAEVEYRFVSTSFGFATSPILRPVVFAAGDSADVVRDKIVTAVNATSGLNVLAANGGGIAVATDTLTFGGNALNTEVVVIGSATYTFQTALTDVDGNVLIGASASDSLDNLIAAITLGAGAGSLYAASTTVHPTATAVAGGGDTMDASALDGGVAGNTIVTTTDVTAASWSGAGTMSGGTEATVDLEHRLGGTSGNVTPTADTVVNGIFVVTAMTSGVNRDFTDEKSIRTYESQVTGGQFDFPHLIPQAIPHGQPARGGVLTWIAERVVLTGDATSYTIRLMLPDGSTVDLATGAAGAAVEGPFTLGGDERLQVITGGGTGVKVCRVMARPGIVLPSSAF